MQSDFATATVRVAKPPLLRDVDPIEEVEIEEHDIRGGAFCRRPHLSSDEDSQGSEMFWTTFERLV